MTLKLMRVMQSKLQNGNTTVAKTQSTETNSDSSSNKTTTIVVTGQGKTKYEAQQNALRNAIEQAFGAFISSKTEVLNDSLVKDEIVSVSNAILAPSNGRKMNLDDTATGSNYYDPKTKNVFITYFMTQPGFAPFKVTAKLVYKKAR